MLTVLSDTVKTAFPEPSERPGKVEQDAASRWTCEWHVHRTLEIQLRGKQVDLSYNTTPPTSHPFFLWAQRAFLALLLTMLKNRKIKWLSVIPVSTAITVNPLAMVILSFIHEYINYKKSSPIHLINKFPFNKILLFMLPINCVTYLWYVDYVLEIVTQMRYFEMLKAQGYRK